MLQSKRPFAVWFTIVLLGILAIASGFVAASESRQVTFRTFTSIATALWIASSFVTMIFAPTWGRRLTMALLIWTVGVFVYGYCGDLMHPPRQPVSKHFFLAPTVFTAAWLVWLGLSRRSRAYFKQQKDKTANQALQTTPVTRNEI